MCQILHSSDSFVHVECVVCETHGDFGQTTPGTNFSTLPDFVGDVNSCGLASPNTW